MHIPKPRYISKIEAFGHGDFSPEQIEQKCAVIRDLMRKRPVKDKPLISVIIPAYREERYLLAGLYSLATQRFEDCEYIMVVNGEGEDSKTLKIAKECGFQVMHVPEKGISNARQRGLEAARGRIIVSADADSIFQREWLEEVARFFEKNDCTATKGKIAYLTNDQRVKLYLCLANLAKELLEEERPIERDSVSGANSAFLRERALAVGGYNTHIISGEDYDLFARLCPGEVVPTIKTESNRVFSSARRIEKVLPSHIANALFFAVDKILGKRQSNIAVEGLYAQDHR